MFTGWSNFFTVTGAAGATLVGLLFVVITLNTDLSTPRKLEVARASMTPALYSFTDVLLQSMVVLVPWQLGHYLSNQSSVGAAQAQSQGHSRAG